MIDLAKSLNHILTCAVMIYATFTGASFAGSDLENLQLELREAPHRAEAVRLESEIAFRWSQSGSPSIDLLYRQARSAFEKGDFAQSFERLGAVLDHDPRFFEASFLRAQAAFQMGRLGFAQADAAMTIAIEPHHFAALTLLGRIAEQLGQNKDAQAAYEAALQAHPFFEPAAQGLARVEKAQGGETL